MTNPNQMREVFTGGSTLFAIHLVLLAIYEQ